MKAYRQINFKTELRLVWSYTSALLFVGLFILFRPVIAQEDKPSIPELKIDIKKECDESGRLVGLDTVRSWNWSGRNLSSKEFDSIWVEANKDIKDFLPRNFDFSGHFGMNSFPPLHNFWYWNEEDSSAYSYLDDLFDEDMMNYFKNYSIPPGFDSEWQYLHPDSLINRYPDWFGNRIDHSFRDFQDRFEGYRREHQQLIEKYFMEPRQNGGIRPESEQYLPAPCIENDRTTEKI